MSGKATQLYNLNKQYMQCVSGKMEEFFQNKDSNVSKETEWCKDEKMQYYNYMKEHFKHEYENIIRIETNNY